MANEEFDVPIVFLIYNRPSKTARIFSKISETEPESLYVIAGGPDKDKPGDGERTAEARAQIDVNWDCDLNKRYYDSNHGPFEGVYTGLDWVFDQENRAIILEDDTLPSDSFFSYCQTLLERYSDDERIMSITGYNRRTTWKEDEADYHFSHYPCSWGWATWDRAWKLYDPYLKQWGSEFIKERVKDCLGHSAVEFQTRKRWYDALSAKSADEIDSWDGQWAFAHHINSGLSIFPSRNLVENIGFDEDATHTTDTSSPDAGRETFEIPDNVSHPNHVTVDREYDKLINDHKQYHLAKRIFWYLQDRV